MDGISFLEALRQDNELKTSIVFVLTVSEKEEHLLAAYNEQVAGYFLKKRVGEDFFCIARIDKEILATGAVSPLITIAISANYHLTITITDTAE